MKKTIKKSQLKRLVESTLNELDWKTYANYAKGRMSQGDWRKAKQGEDAMVNAFNKKHSAFEDDYLDGDYLSSGFHMANGSGNGRLGDIEYTSQRRPQRGWGSDSGTGNTEYISRNRSSKGGPEMNGYMDSGVKQGQWYGQNGMNNNDVNDTQNQGWSFHVRNKMNNAIRDLDNYHSGNANYTKGKGWTMESDDHVVDKFTNEEYNRLVNQITESVIRRIVRK